MIFDKDYPCTDKTHDFHCRYMSDGFCVYGYDDDRLDIGHRLHVVGLCLFGT